MNNFDNYLKQQLVNFENSNTCNLCSQKFISPLRIKICGHYFCEECLETNKNNEQCPKCQEHFERNQVDYQNAARKVQKYLDELKMYFCDGNEVENETKENDDKANTFVYKGRRYQVIHFNELFKKVNMKGESPLHIACQKKKLEDVMNLLKQDIDINVQDFAGWAPLHEAVESECFEIVETLLKHGALVDIMGEDYTTPLHKAAILKNKAILKLLLKYGASKEVCDYFGNKPIEYLTDEDTKHIFDAKIECVDRIQKIFRCKKISAYCYYVDNQYKDKLKSLKNVKILNDFSPKKITHFFIQKTHKISVKMFVAMLNGCLITPQEFIDNLQSDDYFFDVPSYTYVNNLELNRGIQKAMTNSFLKLPQLFDGIRFFIHGHKSRISVKNIKMTRQELASLITEGGGKILPRAPTPTTCESFRNFPYHSNKKRNSCRCCHYIIYEESDPPAILYQMPDLKHRSSSWLIDCIINFSIID